MKRRHFIQAVGDFPSVPTGPQQQQLADLGLSAAEIDGIRSENAMRLMPRLRG